MGRVARGGEPGLLQVKGRVGDVRGGPAGPVRLRCRFEPNILRNILKIKN